MVIPYIQILQKNHLSAVSHATLIKNFNKMVLAR